MYNTLQDSTSYSPKFSCNIDKQMHFWAKKVSIIIQFKQDKLIMRKMFSKTQITVIIKAELSHFFCCSHFLLYFNTTNSDVLGSFYLGFILDFKLPIYDICIKWKVSMFFQSQFIQTIWNISAFSFSLFIKQE